MEPQSDLPSGANWAWVIWCLTPAAALMLCVGRVPLWLTMPIASENGAMGWVLTAQAIALFAVVPAFDRRGESTSAAAAAIAFLTLAWLASNQNWRSYLLAAVAAVIVVVLLQAVARRAARLVFPAKAGLLVVCLILLLR